MNVDVSNECVHMCLFSKSVTKMHEIQVTVFKVCLKQ